MILKEKNKKAGIKRIINRLRLIDDRRIENVKIQWNKAKLASPHSK
jgi:hypothetical protein